MKKKYKKRSVNLPINSNIFCKTRENWIDILRGIAILAVITDHSLYFFPAFWNTIVSNHTFFSVNWFIFLSGYTNSMSLSQIGKIAINHIINFYQRRFNIIYPFIIATIFYYIYFSFPTFNIQNLISKIINFSGSYHLYFIQVILQLYLLFPFIFIIIQKTKKNVFRILILGIIGLISFKILPINQPPWNYQNFYTFLGMAYILTFTTGIVYFFQSIKVKKIIFYSSCLVFIIMEIYLFVSKGIFSISIPNLKLIAWSISLLIIVKYLIEKLSINNKVISIISYLGRKSIPIYLYHFLILLILSKTVFATNFIFMIFSICLSIMLSLVIDNLYTRLTTALVKLS